MLNRRIERQGEGGREIKAGHPRPIGRMWKTRRRGEDAPAKDYRSGEKTHLDRREGVEYRPAAWAASYRIWEGSKSLPSRRQGRGRAREVRSRPGTTTERPPDEITIESISPVGHHGIGLEVYNAERKRDSRSTHRCCRSFLPRLAYPTDRAARRSLKRHIIEIDQRFRRRWMLCRARSRQTCLTSWMISQLLTSTTVDL